MIRTLFASVLALSCAAPRLDAGFIDFYSTQPLDSQLNFATNGALSGPLSITNVSGSGTPLNPNGNFNITNGLFNFSLTNINGGDGVDQFGYGPGNTFTLAGQLPGHASPEVLMSGDLEYGSSYAYPYGGYYYFYLTIYLEINSVSQSVHNLFGGATSGPGTLSLVYFGSPGRFADPNNILIQFQASPAITAPEPASLAMVSLGLGLAGIVGRRRRN